MTEGESSELEKITFAEFLESTPPGRTKKIVDLYVIENHLITGGDTWVISTPDISL